MCTASDGVVSTVYFARKCTDTAMISMQYSIEIIQIVSFQQRLQQCKRGTKLRNRLKNLQHVQNNIYGLHLHINCPNDLSDIESYSPLPKPDFHRCAHYRDNRAVSCVLCVLHFWLYILVRCEFGSEQNLIGRIF